MIKQYPPVSVKDGTGFLLQRRSQIPGVAVGLTGKALRELFYKRGLALLNEQGKVCMSETAFTRGSARPLSVQTLPNDSIEKICRDNDFTSKKKKGGGMMVMMTTRQELWALPALPSTSPAEGD